MSDWRDDAGCLGADPELFFPTGSESAKVAKAKVICAGCAVRQQCLDVAIPDASLEGVWGGLSAIERRKLRARALSKGVRGSVAAQKRRAEERARQIIALREAGVDPTEIAQQLNICRETVYRAPRVLERAA